MICHRCEAEGDHGDTWRICVHAAFVRGTQVDDDRWAWLQAKFGATPWKLTGWLPGTHDVRKAIDHAITKDLDEKRRKREEL